MITVVQKVFTAFGQPRKTGELIDTTDSPHEQKLIRQRYLRPATESEVKQFEQRSRETPKAPEPTTTASTTGFDMTAGAAPADRADAPTRNARGGAKKKTTASRKR